LTAETGFVTVNQSLTTPWPKQVPHPESVAGELIFGLPGSVGFLEASPIPTRLVESGF
jgi:hypothetical protein